MLVLLGEQYTEGSYVGIIVNSIQRVLMLGEQYTEGSYVGIIGEQYTEGTYVGIIRWTVYRGLLCWYY